MLRRTFKPRGRVSAWREILDFFAYNKYEIYISVCVFALGMLLSLLAYIEDQKQKDFFNQICKCRCYERGK